MLKSFLKLKWDESTFWGKIRLIGIVVLLSPVILAAYLGMWADGWLDKRIDRE